MHCLAHSHTLSCARRRHGFKVFGADDLEGLRKEYGAHEAEGWKPAKGATRLRDDDDTASETAAETAAEL